MSTHVVSFERLKDEFLNSPDFGTIYKDLLDSPSQEHVGFSFVMATFSRLLDYASHAPHLETS